MRHAEHNARFAAFYVFMALVFILLWRKIGLCILGKPRMKRVQLTEYICLYAVLLLLFIDTSFRGIPRLFEIASLDAKSLEENFLPALNELRAANSTLNATELLNDVSLQRFPALKWASILVFFPALATWFICLMDTCRHVRVMWYKSCIPENSKKWHDRAVQILALPTAYALMSLSAVTRVWDIMCNSFSDDIQSLEGWEERRLVALKFYEAHYQIADLYEAWALFHFGKLALEVVDLKFRVRAKRAENEDCLSPVASGGRSLAKLAASIHSSVQNLTMQGIWLFVIVCFTQSVYGVGTPLLIEAFKKVKLGKDDERFSYMLHAIEQSEDYISNVFTGMGLVASAAAIGNIVQVEFALHEELRQFKPYMKFWGTKVLVSLSFIQDSIVSLPIPPFSAMSELHKSLFYSTILCYECFFVSLLHIWAWAPHEPWYDETMSSSIEIVEKSIELSVPLRTMSHLENA